MSKDFRELDHVFCVPLYSNSDLMNVRAMFAGRVPGSQRSGSPIAPLQLRNDPGISASTLHDCCILRTSGLSILGRDCEQTNTSPETRRSRVPALHATITPQPFRCLPHPALLVRPAKCLAHAYLACTSYTLSTPQCSLPRCAHLAMLHPGRPPRPIAQ